jgi:hypothetical protein
MDNSRMSTADMLQYCEEALAWEDFGPIDIFFFESVKKILLGQASVTEEPEEVIDDLMGIERPVRDVELEPEYDKYADIYYGEEGDDDIPDYSRSKEDEAFDEVLSGGGGFFDQAQKAKAAAAAQADGSTPAAEQNVQSSYTESTGSSIYTLSDEGTSTFTESSKSTYTLSDDAAKVSTDAAAPAESSAYTFSDKTYSAAAPENTEKAAVTAPASVNLSTVSSENADLDESGFNELKESLEAAAAAVENAIKNK